MRKIAVNPDTAGFWHQGFHISSYLFRGHTGYHNVCCRSVLVLGECFATHFFIVAWCPVCAVQLHRSCKMCPDFLQHLNQIRMNQNYITAVLAPELSHLKICA